MIEGGVGSEMTANRDWTMHKVKRPKLLLESEGSWLKPVAVSSV